MPFNTKTTPGRGTSLRRRISPVNNSAPARRDILRDQGRISPVNNSAPARREALREQGRPGSTDRGASPNDPAWTLYAGRSSDTAPDPQPGWTLYAGHSATPAAPAAKPVTNSNSGMDFNSDDWLGTPNGRPLGWGGGSSSSPTTNVVPSSGDFKNTFEKQYMNLRARRSGEPEHEWLRRISKLDNMYKEFNSLGSWQDQQRWLMTVWDKFRERPGVDLDADAFWRDSPSVPSPADRVRDNVSAMLGDDTQPSIRRSTGGTDPRLNRLNNRGR